MQRVPIIRTAFPVASACTIDQGSHVMSPKGHKENGQTTQVHKSSGFSSAVWNTGTSSEAVMTSAFSQNCKCNLQSGRYPRGIGYVWRESEAILSYEWFSMISPFSKKKCIIWRPIIFTCFDYKYEKKITFGGQKFQFPHLLFQSTLFHNYYC